MLYTRFQLSLILLILLGANISVAAVEGEGELGYTVNKGNTDNENLNARLGIVYIVSKWTHSAELASQRVAESKVTTTNRIQFNQKSGYKFTEHDYIFGALRYDDDKFSGFEHQTSISFGYGRRWIENDKTVFETEFGAGYKKTETDTRPVITEEESVIRLGTEYKQKLSDTTEFLQSLLFESTDSNDYAESQTGLKVAMNDRLALKLSYTTKRNSNPPAGNDKADITSAITLVYDFY